MVGWAITELYSYVEEKIPAEIEAKLKDVKTLPHGRSCTPC